MEITIRRCFGRKDFRSKLLSVCQCDHAFAQRALEVLDDEVDPVPVGGDAREHGRGELGGLRRRKGHDARLHPAPSGGGVLTHERTPGVALREKHSLIERTRVSSDVRVVPRPVRWRRASTCFSVQLWLVQVTPPIWVT